MGGQTMIYSGSGEVLPALKTFLSSIIFRVTISEVIALRMIADNVAIIYGLRVFGLRSQLQKSVSFRVKNGE